MRALFVIALLLGLSSAQAQQSLVPGVVESVQQLEPDSPGEVDPKKDPEEFEVLFTMLAPPAGVREAALGEGGFLGGMRRGLLWIDCSTVNPSFSREMAAAALGKKLRSLDAPVAGSRGPAEKGELTFFVGGNAADVLASGPLLRAMGKDIVHVGSHGMGASLKMGNNLLLASSMAAFAEGLVLGEALGISRNRLLELLMKTPLVAPYLATKREKIERSDYSPEFPLEW